MILAAVPVSNHWLSLENFAVVNTPPRFIRLLDSGISARTFALLVFQIIALSYFAMLNARLPSGESLTRLTAALCLSCMLYWGLSRLQIFALWSVEPVIAMFSLAFRSTLSTWLWWFNVARVDPELMSIKSEVWFSSATIKALLRSTIASWLILLGDWKEVMWLPSTACQIERLILLLTVAANLPLSLSETRWILWSWLVLCRHLKSCWLLWLCHRLAPS